MRTSPLKWSGQHLILRRVLEQSVQMLPVGSPFQDVVLTAQLLVNSETSLERLVPLVDFTLVHFCQYISLGPADYRKSISIQFGSRLPRFRGVFSTEVPPHQVLVMEQEVKALLEKRAIEYVPHSNRKTKYTASIS